MSALSSEFIARPATLNDADNVVTLIQQEHIEKYGQSAFTSEKLLHDWKTPGFSIESSTQIVFTQDGQIVGYSGIWDVGKTPVRPYVWGYTHPDFRNRGIGTYLMDWGERRAQEVIPRVPVDARVVLEKDCLSTDDTTRQLLTRHGFKFAEQSWWHMLIQLDTEPSQPTWPDGIRPSTIETYYHPEKIARCVDEAFKDHRGHVDEPFELRYPRWKTYWLDSPDYDPSLMIFALDSDQVVGTSLCKASNETDPEEVYLDTLGVIPSHRKRGIALALLHHTFTEMYKRGRKRVGLHVDGSSLTGAQRVYEQAGMKVADVHDSYEKELRPGKELSKQD